MQLRTKLPLFLWAFAATLFAAPATRPSDIEHARKFEPEIAAFEKQDRAMAPPANPIVFVGSSSIRKWKTADAFADLPVLNRGFGGSSISDAVIFAPRIVLPYRPRTIVFYAGDNDIADQKSPETVAADFAAFLTLVRRDLPETRVVVIGIKPSPEPLAAHRNVRDANRPHSQADRARCARRVC